MISLISAYIKTIAAFVLFAAFTEMVMPSGVFQKYVRLLMGILLLLAILNPLLQLYHGGGENMQGLLSDALAGYEAPLLEEEEYEAMNQQQVEEIYQKSYAPQVEESLAEVFGSSFSITAEFAAKEAEIPSALTITGDSSQRGEVQKYLIDEYQISAEDISWNNETTKEGRME